VDLSWLPDPDKVYPSKDMDAEDFDRNELYHERRDSDDDGDFDSANDGDDDDDDTCTEEEEDQDHV
jgi:hypothetical protein